MQKNFVDNEVHASWFQSTARASREMSVNAARRQGRVRAKNDLSARLRHSSFQHSCNKRISKARRVAGERTRSLVYYLIIFRTIDMYVCVK